MKFLLKKISIGISLQISPSESYSFRVGSSRELVLIIQPPRSKRRQTWLAWWFSIPRGKWTSVSQNGFRSEEDDNTNSDDSGSDHSTNDVGNRAAAPEHKASGPRQATTTTTAQQQKAIGIIGTQFGYAYDSALHILVNLVSKKGAWLAGIFAVSVAMLLTGRTPLGLMEGGKEEEQGDVGEQEGGAG